MRFTVPQFIDIEDKIFGPLTWKQFLYVGGGIGMSVVLLLIAPFPIFLLFGLPIGILAAALAFFPVNNRPFSVFLESAFNYFTGQREYYWHKAEERIYKKKSQEKVAEVPNSKTPAVAGTTINSLSRRLELEALQKHEG